MATLFAAEIIEAIRTVYGLQRRCIQISNWQAEPSMEIEILD